MTVISKFIPVDPDNLPDEEVLAIGYQDGVLVGYLYYHKFRNEVTCDNSNTELGDVTAYIPVSQLVELYKQGS